jgi:hypothetical protein
MPRFSAVLLWASRLIHESCGHGTYFHFPSPKTVCPYTTRLTLFFYKNRFVFRKYQKRRARQNHRRPPCRRAGVDVPRHPGSCCAFPESRHRPCEGPLFPFYCLLLPVHLRRTGNCYVRHKRTVQPDYARLFTQATLRSTPKLNTDTFRSQKQLPYTYVNLVSWVVHVYLFVLSTWFGFICATGLNKLSLEGSTFDAVNAVTAVTGSVDGAVFGDVDSNGLPTASTSLKERNTSLGSDYLTLSFAYFFLVFSKYVLLLYFPNPGRLFSIDTFFKN